MMRLPDGRLRTAAELFRRQSPVVPGGHRGFSCWFVSVVMKVPRLPDVPGLSSVLSLLRPRAFPTKVKAPFVVTTWRCTYPGPCAAIGFDEKRTAAVKRRQTHARRNEYS